LIEDDGQSKIEIFVGVNKLFQLKQNFEETGVSRRVGAKHYRSRNFEGVFEL
jgi:hypothetical protein